MSRGPSASVDRRIPDVTDGSGDTHAREGLFERLARIQRSISHRAPLQEVLDAITAGISELLGDECAAVRLIDPDDPGYAINVSYAGLASEVAETIHRTPVGQGAGGQAIRENRLVVIHDYGARADAIPALGRARLQAAMAAPLLEGGEIAGSLIVASFNADRTFAPSEQDALLAFAEHASLALTDARAVQSLRDAQEEKEMFLAMVSHELKTPLTVIMATLQTLSKHPDRLQEAVSAELLDAAVRRGRDLERLIDRLLQGSRTELAGAKRAVALPDLIAEVVSGFESHRRVVVEEASEIQMTVDATAVREVVGILMENAAAHSPADRDIWVGATVNGSELSVFVRNPGSLPEGLDEAALFEPFKRGGDATSPGVGLGLYIAARQAASLGGRIEVHSGGGFVTFTFRCPVEETMPVPGCAPEGEEALEDV
ncbi:MAG: GAF domain-containing protein [Actinomycetota bacterium]